jgi:formate hydrogenlyase subunit 6/NADH:ubiquinone oxidoreductase subunit I
MSAVVLYFHNIFHSLYTVIVGMRITIKHIFTRAATVQYPTVRMKIPERARNLLYVNIDDCIGCDQCSIACPVDCITIETIKSTPDVDLGLTSKNTRKRLYVTKFDIDIAKCCYCGLCVPPCPTDCIFMTDVYEFSEFDRHNLIYNYANMSAEEIAAARDKLKHYEIEQSTKKAAAAAAAKANPPGPGTPPTTPPATQ